MINKKVYEALLTIIEYNQSNYENDPKEKDLNSERIQGLLNSFYLVKRATNNNAR